MNTFPETRNAMQRLVSDMHSGYGQHLGTEMAVGVPGMVVGEERFDPQRHSMSAIDPMSLMEVMEGEGLPYVPQVVPFRPVDINIVMHGDVSDKRLPYPYSNVVDFKKKISIGLANAVIDAVQLGDKVDVLSVGDFYQPNELTRRGVPVTHIPDTAEPQAAAKAIADVSRRGLTFVVSDFNTLRPSETNGIAIKTNHKLERALPANVGVLPLRGLNEVNTNKPKQLQEVNNDLETIHNMIVGGLRSAGMLTSCVVYEEGLKAGLNEAAADVQIAAAVTAYARR